MGSVGRPVVITTGVAVCVLAGLIATISLVKPGRMSRTRSVRELVKMYQRGGGADDYAGPELQKRGDAARDELIRMLDATPTAKVANDETVAIVRILEYEFPSPLSSEAVERLRLRATDLGTQAQLRLSYTALRGKLSGHWVDEAWMEENRTMEPVVQSLHFAELYLANAAPEDRVFFLAEAAQYAFCASRETKRGEQARQAFETKAETYAHELVAIPDLSVKCGDGAYYGNHALGMLALKRGDIAAAKRYVMATANLPSQVSNALPYWPPDPELIAALLAHGERDVVFEYLDRFKENPERAPLVGPWKESIRAGRTPNFYRECILAHAPPKERAWLEREFPP